MKVALVAAQFPVMSETFVLRQALGLVAAGVDLTVVALQPGGDWAQVRGQDLLAQRVRTVPQAGAGKAWRLRLGLLALKSLGSGRARVAFKAALTALRQGQGRAAKEIVAQAREGSLGRYDAVIAHFGPIGVRTMHLRKAGLLEGPLATVFHGYDMSIRETVAGLMPSYRMLFRDTELMLPISEFWRDRLVAWGAPPQNIVVHHMGVDLDAGHALVADRPLGRPLRVLSVGRFTEKKGLRYAIEGVRRAACDVELSIIGFGPLADELQAAASGEGRNSVKFLGPQPHAEVLATLRRSDVFLLPSVEAANGDMEGIPVSLMEAMLEGALVIATRHSGNAELVQDGRSGILVDERSPEQIAKALEAIAGGGVDALAMRAAAYDRVAQGFNNASLDADLVAIVRRLAGPQPREAAAG
jgi:colanic acid/amylovoran biosynthesis glycosyltransferase